jgi:hypothetical protein
MSNRFDLEQQIIKMFDILEDLRLANEQADNPHIKAVILVWEMKIAKLWDTFEEFVHYDANH